MNTQDIELPPLPDYFKAYHRRTKYEVERHARNAIEPYRKALYDLVHDLEVRSELKGGDKKGAVDCGRGVYMQAKRILGEVT